MRTNALIFLLSVFFLLPSCNNIKEKHEPKLTGLWGFVVETDSGLFNYIEVNITDTLISFSEENYLLSPVSYTIEGNKLVYERKEVFFKMPNDYTLVFTEEGKGSVSLERIVINRDDLIKEPSHDFYYLRKYSFLARHGFISASEGIKNLCQEKTLDTEPAEEVLYLREN